MSRWKPCVSGRRMCLSLILEQHTELTPEDEKLLAKILATECDWNPKGRAIRTRPNEIVNKEEQPAIDEMSAKKQETEPLQERFEVTITDAFPDPEDAYAIWDNSRGDYYINGDGMVLTYPTEEDAEAGLLKVRKTAADKEAASPIIARYLSGDEAVVIMQYPNGKYYNRYGYDEQRDTANTTAGGFDTFDEAEKAAVLPPPESGKGGRAYAEPRQRASACTG